MTTGSSRPGQARVTAAVLPFMPPVGRTDLQPVRQPSMFNSGRRSVKVLHELPAGARCTQVRQLNGAHNNALHDWKHTTIGCTVILWRPQATHQNAYGSSLALLWITARGPRCVVWKESELEEGSRMTSLTPSVLQALTSGSHHPTCTDQEQYQAVSDLEYNLIWPEAPSQLQRNG
jgi:hypothetical protein